MEEIRSENGALAASIEYGNVNMIENVMAPFGPASANAQDSTIESFVKSVTELGRPRFTCSGVPPLLLLLLMGALLAPDITQREKPCHMRTPMTAALNAKTSAMSSGLLTERSSHISLMA